MPNGGITPDCVHCKCYTGEWRLGGDTYCQHLKIQLPYIIRAFCANYTDPEPTENGDWLDRELDRATLQDDMMYLWLEWRGEQGTEFFHVPLASITGYGEWTREKFMEEFVLLSDKYREE